MRRRHEDRGAPERRPLHRLLRRGPGNITFTLNGTLSFATDDESHVITSLLIAGGPTNAVLYTWADGTDSDSGLTAPFNPNSGKPYGYSHVCIYTAKK